MKELIMTWSIENFSYSWHTTCDYIESMEFSGSSMPGNTWNLRAYPRGYDDNYNEYLSLELLRMTDEGSDNIAVNVEFSCITADASAIQSSFRLETFDNGDTEILEPRFLKRCEIFCRRKALYLPKDILTLRCRLWKDEDSEEFEQIYGRTQLTIERITTTETIVPLRSIEKTFQIQSKIQNKELISISVLYFVDKVRVRINPKGKVKMKFSTLKLLFRDDLTGRKLCEHISSFFGIIEKEFKLPFSNKEALEENDNSGWRFHDFITEFTYSTGEKKNAIEKNCPVGISKFLENYINSFNNLGDHESNIYFTISDDLGDFSQKKVICDVKLKIENETLEADKTVLCARSPVFLAMLTSGMEESRIGCTEIKDISANTLKIFLHFLYIDCVGDLEWDAIIELYYAADKYGVELLKLLCCSRLLQKIDVENVCDLLMLADKHHDCKLERKILDFISKNDEKVFRSSSWKKFTREQENKGMAMKAFGWKYEEKENQSPTETYEDWISSHPKIQDDFGALYQGQIVSDVVIKAAGATFPAHKAVLCASSARFMEVFTKDFGDKSTDFFEMADLDVATVSRMLLFLYSDSLDIQWDSATKLYKVATEYQIKRLKIKCSCFLLENLNVSNASDLLLLAHAHGDSKLQSIVESYIILHDEEIFGSDEWAAFSEANFRLANETMRLRYRRK